MFLGDAGQTCTRSDEEEEEKEEDAWGSSLEEEGIQMGRSSIGAAGERERERRGRRGKGLWRGEDVKPHLCLEMRDTFYSH